MPADFDKPVKEDRYTAILTQVRDNEEALATQDLSGADHLPEGAIQFNVTNARWERWVSGAWQALRALTQIFEMKVRDTDQLNGQTADYYRNADNLNAGTVNTDRLDTTTDYDSSSTTRVPVASALKRLYDWAVGQLATKAASHHTHAAADLNSGTVDAARMPGISASKIISGILAVARMPNIPASKITSGNLTRPWQPSGSKKLTKITVSSATPSAANLQDGELYLKY